VELAKAGTTAAGFLFAPQTGPAAAQS
jgi:hypothetical protein